jgi:hypothetical protein
MLVQREEFGTLNPDLTHSYGMLPQDSDFCQGFITSHNPMLGQIDKPAAQGLHPKAAKSQPNRSQNVSGHVSRAVRYGVKSAI